MSVLTVMTCNLNGIRAAERKGFFTWMLKQDVDVVCVQETKAQMAVLEGEVYRPAGYHCYFADAEKKGYSGVGIFTRHKPDKVVIGLGWECADKEGRYVQADFGDLSIASLYLPSGTSGGERQALKYEFLDNYYEDYLRHMATSGREFILCGDWNIAHKQIDLKNWRGNQKNSGFLPEERAWLDKVFDEAGLVDAFRVHNTEEDQYTWWSYRGQARANNVGWRIDYHIVTPGLAEKIHDASIYTEEIFSDHAPLTLRYDWTI